MVVAGGAGIVAAALVGAVGYVAAIAPSGTGYKAQTACSAIFISGRDVASLDAAEFAGLHPLLGYIHPEIDRRKGEVRASLFGLGAQKSVFRPGLGCTLVDTNVELPAPPLALTAPRAKPADAIEHGIVAPPPGTDVSRLRAAIDAAFAEPDPDHLRHTRAMLVLYGGRVIAERYAPGFNKSMPLAGYSMTKTITGALVGIVASRGLVDIAGRAPVPEWQVKNDPRGAITVDQLLHMTTGMHWSEETDDPLSPVLMMLYHKRDAAHYAAGLKLDHPPGTQFAYNSGSTDILARIVRRAMHDDAAYLSLPRNAIFDKAGMSSAVIAPDASGTLLGHMQGFATARDWARFGELFLHDGERNGVQVLAPGWVAFARQPRPASALRGYGAQIWINKAMPGQPDQRPSPSLPQDTMLLNGQFGQMTAIVPSRRVIIVRLGEAHRWDFANDPDQLVASVLAALPKG